MSVTWTSPDRDSEPFPYETVHAWIINHLGNRVRLTYPNGARISGIAGTKLIAGHPIATIDGATKMGELAGAVKLEAMIGTSNRYTIELSAA